MITMAKPGAWPFVYRLTWFKADGSPWTRRLTKEGAADWQRIFNNSRDYELRHGREFKDRIVIERAPVGVWETIYEGEELTGDIPGASHSRSHETQQGQAPRP